MSTMDQPQTIRVAHLLDARHFGGAEEIARRLIRAAPATGVEARAYILSEGRLAQVLREEGLPVRVFGSAGKFDLRMLRALTRAAREDGVQILQAHTSRTHMIARIVSRWLGIKNITTIHSPIALDENRGNARHPWRAWIERMGRPWTDLIVTVSREERERLIAEEGVAPRDIMQIPNGVEPTEVLRGEARARIEKELNRQGKRAEGLLIAMIAQMRPRKGPDVLLEAFAAFRAAGHAGTLLMIGDDSFTEGAGYLDQLAQQAQRLGIAGETLFTGFVAQPWRLAAGADALVLPSRFGEGMPLVLLEAMQHHLPIFASNSAGNRELVKTAEDCCGWLHAPGDAAGLAAQLAEGTEHPEELKIRGERGGKFFEQHYTIANVAQLYRKSYDAVLGSR